MFGKQPLTLIYRSFPKLDRIRAFGGKIMYVSKYSPTVIASLSNKKVIERLKKDPDLLYIGQNHRLQLPFYRIERVTTSQRNSQKMLASKQVIPWNILRVINGKRSLTGRSVRVGVIDTGIDLTHPDLVANIKGGVNIVTPSQPPKDVNGHGTHIAGVIGAINNSIGVVGIAPKVSLYAIKVLNSQGSGSLTDLIKGIEWGIANRMHILNISISGGKNIPPALSRVVNEATKRGIFVVAAAGNSGTPSGQGDTVEIPARIPSAIAVAALDRNNKRGNYSATGPSIDIAAPGTEILSTYSQKRYATLTGTSMAAAHVSGVLALMRQAYPHLSVKKMKSLLQSRAIDLPPKGFDRYTGAGLVQL
ncbi:S8 family peptidase [Hazenella coriacea]|uniref:Subtilase family protein n=1 Tax=Hazenella coriacea TaxID=1179467 RepID=A0A4R3L5E7_9BACL|nr:S8 family peptidase [Hazenella coriacea]TCS95021.1 subtilase family protein [Hazenella coriacea]